MSKTILIVDDEERMVTLIASYLVQEGYRVVTSENGRKALDAAKRENPDLIILDVMMPEMDGYEFMRLHRQESDSPIIMLTARVDDHEKVLGLELGADDYITKPFRPRELVARVKAVLRRTGKDNPAAAVISLGGITLDREMHTVQVNEREINLTPSEFDLLAALMTTPGKVFTRLDLLDVIQGVRYEGYERTIDTHIKNLRAKIEPNPGKPMYIKTEYGVGYRFVRK